jgi:hypothetical protein
VVALACVDYELHHFGPDGQALICTDHMFNL